MRPNARGAGLIAALLALWLASSAMYVLPQGRIDLVLRFGAPVRIDRSAGLKFKIPFADTVQIDDARLQTLAPPPQELILGDEKRLAVETFTTYRIVDPLRFYQTVMTNGQARFQLDQLVSTSLRMVLGTVPLSALLSDQRRAVVAQVAAAVEAKAATLGIVVHEVRLHRADLPLAASQSIYARMRSSRQREAKELRAQGLEWQQEIEAAADRDRTQILAKAKQSSQVIRGEADAQANRVLSQAYDRDPKFYRYYRALLTYRHALAASDTTLVLSPDSAVLRAFKRGPAAAAR
ncbi:modulator of FtsH protease HflC [mine drainage metagenome]|jgi:membrane protease subunit HflC|uniref:Modulator of FtsH protease HflC n=1 Tax=mine drainage metagenome TaxID=410659 RepID=A0A1J5QIE8_9ZZZZ